MRKFNNNLTKMYAVGFLTSLHFFSAVLVPMLTIWAGLSFTQAMILQSIFVVSVTILEIPTGAVADIYGRKVSLAMGMLIAFIAFEVYGFDKTFVSCVIGEVLIAFAASLISGADSAMIYDSLKQEGQEKHASKAFGRFQSVRMLGILIAGPIGSVIASKFGMIAPMRVTGITAFLAFLIVVMLKEPSIEEEKLATTFRKQVKQLFVGIKVLKHDRKLLDLALDFAIMAVVGKTMIWLYQPLLSDVGMPIAYFGFVSFFFVLIELLLMANTNVVIDMLKGIERVFSISRIVPLVGLVLAVVAVIVGANLLGQALAVVSVTLVVAFALGRKPYFDAVMNKRIASKDRATVNSTVRMISMGIMFVANPIIGYATDKVSILAPLLGLVLVASVWIWHKQE